MTATESTVSAALDARLPDRWTARSLFGLAALLAVLLLSTNLQIQTLLIEPIRAELGLTDLQLGQLHGLTVVTLGALAAWPIGWLADRWDRRWVLALCVGVWSAATYGGGLSQGFDGLLWAMVQVALSLITLGWFQLMLWTPAILGRSFGSTVGGAGLDFGLVVTLASAVGTLAGLYWVTRPHNRDNPVGNFHLVRYGTLASLPMVVAMAWAPSAGVLLLLCGLALTCIVIGVSQAPALLQQMSPPALLSRSIALFPLVALPIRGLQAPAVGLLSDAFGAAAPRGLLHAMVIVAGTTLALGVLALWRLEGRYATLVAHARAAPNPHA